MGEEVVDPAQLQETDRKRLTAEQLKEFSSREVDLEEAGSYLATALGVPDHVCDARGAILVDYFAGILSFAKDNSFGLEQASMIYEIGADVLDVVKGGGSFQVAEALFRPKVMALCKAKSSPDAPLLFSTIDVKKITDFFITTLFQHYRLYHHCFIEDQEHLALQETVLIETADNLPPLVEALNERELGAYKEAQATAAAAAELAAKAKAEEEAAAEAAARAAEEAERTEEKRKKKPQTLEEAVEFAVRDRLGLEKQKIQEEYAAREQELLEKIQRLETQLKA